MQKYKILLLLFVSLTILLLTKPQNTQARPLPSNIVIPTRPPRPARPVYQAPAPTIVTNSPTPTSTPTPTNPPNASQNDIQSYILNDVNNYRASKGKSQVQANSYTCQLASVRAQEISSNFSHSGLQVKIDNRTLPYPGYSYITENLAQTSNYKEVVNLWINSPGHEANLVADTPYVCIGIYGNYYAMEGWRP